MSKSFTFFQSFADTGRKMCDKDRLAFYDAIIGCAIYGEEPKSMPKLADLVFTAIRPILEANVRDRENGGKGGRPKNKTKEENPLENPLFKNNETPKQNPTLKPISNSNSISNSICIKEKSIEKKVANAPAPPKKFVKPTLEQVKDYVKNMGYYGFDAERFLAYYESNGWRVGRNPMKDWEAAIRNWHRKDKEEGVSADYISRTQIPDPSIYENIQSTI